MNRIVFLLILLPTLAFATGARRAATAEAVPVVAVYCEALLSSGNASGPLFDESSWQELAERLESRKLQNPESQSSPTMRSCMEAHAAEFQDAEFLLKGRALVAAAAEEIRQREARYHDEWKQFVSRLKPSARERVTAEAGHH